MRINVLKMLLLSIIFLIGLKGFTQEIIISDAIVAEVSEAEPDTDQDESDLKIQSKAGASFKSFIMFDISSLAGDIGSAALKLYMAQHEETSEAGLITPARVILIPVENTDWDGTLTWNQAEANGLINPDSYSLDYVDVTDYNKPHLSGSDSKWYYLNNSLITNYVNTKVSEGASKIAFAMVAMDSIAEHDVWIGNWSNKVPTLHLLSGPAPLEISPTDVAEIFQATPTIVSPEGTSDLKVQRTTTGNDIVSLAKFDISGITSPVSNVDIQVYGAQHEDVAALDPLDEYMIEVYEGNSQDWNGAELTWDAFMNNVGHADIGVALFDMNNRNSNSASNLRSIKSKIISNVKLTELFNSYVAEGRSEITLVFKGGTLNDDFDAWFGGTWRAPVLYAEFGQAPISIVAINDGEVNSTMPDVVNPDGNLGDLKFQTKTNGDQIRSYIKFDVSELDAENIEYIRMQFYGNQHEGDVIPERYLLDVYGCNDVDNIDNTTLTYNISEAFSLSEKSLGRVDIPTGAEANNKIWKYRFTDEYALTDYVKTQIDSGKTEVGFALLANEFNDYHDAYVGGAAWKAPELKVFQFGIFTEPEMELGQQLTPIEDSWVGEAEPFVNHDGEADMNVTKSAGDTREAYLKFDLSISSVADKISLELKGAQKADDDWTAIDNFNVNIYGCEDNTWAEAGLIWANKPTISTDVLATLNITVTESEWFVFEGTALNDYINNRISLGEENVTLAIFGADETPGSRVWFSSKDWQAPKLNLYYNASYDVASPSFDPVPGLYAPPSQNVTLSSITEGAKIYYTLDGSVPNEQSNEYTSAITITAEMQRVMVKAVSIKDGIRSYMSLGEYVIGTQEPYDGSPFVVPGTITAWKYDLGGQGVAYNELTPDIIGDCGSEKESLYSIRKDDGLIDGCYTSDGKGEIGWASSGEWTEYTIDVSESRDYTAGLRYLKATNDYPGSILVEEVDDNGNVVQTLVETTSLSRNVAEGDWGADVYETSVLNLTSNFNLDEGIHIVRVTWVDDNWNFAELEIHPYSSIDENANLEYMKVYPNPADNLLNVEINAKANDHVNTYLMDVSGRVLHAKAVNIEVGVNSMIFDLSQFNAGVYFVVVENSKDKLIQKVTILK